VQNSLVKTYQCPSDPTEPTVLGRTSYSHNGQVFRHNYRWGNVGLLGYPRSFIDGTSNTALFYDGLRRCNGGNYPDRFWPDWGGVTYSSDLGNPTGAGNVRFQALNQMTGNMGVCAGDFAASPHPSVINVAMADGAVRAANIGTPGAILWAALTPNGSEVFPGWE
jgi:prepilin-type processing-associated H-X9-DG protein